jgi:hypothetical protein
LLGFNNKIFNETKNLLHSQKALLSKVLGLKGKLEFDKFTKDYAKSPIPNAIGSW